MGISFDPSRTLVDLAVAEFAPQPVAGHGRGRVVEAFSADQLRGVPILGLGVGGAINGTRPGDSALELERAGREIVKANLERNRFKPADQ
jgi:hypothetical protein